MPLWYGRLSTVAGAAAVFVVFLLRFITLDENAPGRTVIVVALWASGFVLFMLLEGLFLSRFALHRARHPERLMAAVSRGSHQVLPPGESVQDAVRLMLVAGRQLDALAGVAAALPRTISARPGPDAAWLAPLRKKGNQVVLARTQGHLLVCQPDIERTIHVIAAFPFARLQFVEVSGWKLLGRRRNLVGIGFDDGSSMVTAHDLLFEDALIRFFDPLVSRLSGVRPPGREFARLDYTPRFTGRHLGEAELVDAVVVFIKEATVAEHGLREYLESAGLAPGRPLVNADFDLSSVGQIGDLPEGGGYWFHGLGCEIKVPGQPRVDFDWRRDGSMVIDAWKIGRWLKLHGACDLDPTRVADAMSELADQGVLVRGESWSIFEVVRRPDLL